MKILLLENTINKKNQQLKTKDKQKGGTFLRLEY
jgi:hypothetical protein